MSLTVKFKNIERQPVSSTSDSLCLPAGWLAHLKAGLVVIVFLQCKDLLLFYILQYLSSRFWWKERTDDFTVKYRKIKSMRYYIFTCRLWWKMIDIMVSMKSWSPCLLTVAHPNTVILCLRLQESSLNQNTVVRNINHVFIDQNHRTALKVCLCIHWCEFTSLFQGSAQDAKRTVPPWNSKLKTAWICWH